MTRIGIIAAMEEEITAMIVKHFWLMTISPIFICRVLHLSFVINSKSIGLPPDCYIL